MENQTTQWVVLQLTQKADNEDPDLIKASIRHRIRDAEIFIPASVVTRGEMREFHYLMEGYAFVRNRHPVGHYARLEETKYVQGPLYVPASRRSRDKKLATVPQSKIDEMIEKIQVEVDQGIAIGDTVLITSGPYKHISAIVRDEILEQEAVIVHIQLRSTDRLVTLPRAFLQLKMKSPMVTYKPRLDVISAWVRAARAMLNWSDEGLSELEVAAQSYHKKDDLLSRTRAAYLFVEAYYTNLDFTSVWDTWHHLQLLQKAHLLEQQIQAIKSKLPSLKPLEKVYAKWEHLNHSHTKMQTLNSDVRRMTEIQPVNLVVDGTQLFIRCSEAPGLGTLTDSKGRITGPIVGFLRALGAYQKRFPKARIYVCWDGSSQRRKAMYAGYKANRASRSSQTSFGLEWLRENLPLFGVEQAYNPVEEADDVMAALVRGPFLGLPNVMVTSDRDLLQVVTETTLQLCPAMGGGKEKIYDPLLVQEEYGVLPPKVVHIRALSGDKSDNIPGVPGFGVKTAAKIIRNYGSAPGLLKSNLAGLSKKQSEKLQGNKEQILKNLELLQLQDVPFESVAARPDSGVAEAELTSLEIKAEPIIKAFFA